MGDPGQIEVVQIERLDEETRDRLVEYGRAALGESALDEWMLPVIASCGWLYAAILAGEIVGSAEVIRRRSDDEVYLEGFYIRPEFQGRGIGRRLLARVMGLLAGAGFRRVWATLDPENAPGAALYRRCGFVRSGDLPGHYGPGRDRLLLVADLEGKQ